MSTVIVDYSLAATFLVEACGEVVFRAKAEEYIPHVETKNILLCCLADKKSEKACLHGNESFSGRNTTNVYFEIINCEPLALEKKRMFFPQSQNLTKDLTYQQ